MRRKKRVFVDSHFWHTLVDKASPHYNECREQYESLVGEGAKFYTSGSCIQETVKKIIDDQSVIIAEKFYHFIVKNENTGKLYVDGFSRRHYRESLNLFLEMARNNNPDFDLARNLAVCRNKKVYNYLTVDSQKKRLEKNSWIRVL